MLARYYHQHPNSFLCEPLSAIEHHLAMTNKMIGKLPQAERDDG